MAAEEEFAKALASVNAPVAGDDAPELLHACARLASEFRLPAAEFADAWEAFSLNAQLPSSRPTIAALALFRDTLATTASSSLTIPRQPSPPSYTAADVQTGDDEFYAAVAAPAPDIPMPDSDAPPPAAPPVVLAEAVLSKSLLTEDIVQEDSFGAKIEIVSATAATQYRFMASPLEDRAIALDQQLELMRPVLAAAMSGADLTEPFDETQLDEIVAYGRVCFEEPEDPTAAEPRLTASNALLQAPLSMRSARVKLLLSETTHAVFPGQIVAVTGNNPSGALLIPKSITTLPAFPLESSRPASGRKSYSIVTAAGPFTPNNVLDFTLFQALITSVLKSAPDILLLTGPFIDINHPEVHTLTSEYAAVFKEAITTQLLRLDGTVTRVVVVPAVQDAVTDYCVLPQPPFDASLFSGCSNVVSAPNPCVLRVDGGALTIGVCSADIVKHIAGQFVMGAQSHDRIACICEALIQMRSFYPLHPTDPSLGVEYTQIDKLQFPSFTPDLLVLPSQLGAFSRRVDVPSPVAAAASALSTTLCINPGVVAKSEFCKLTVTPAATAAKVEIWKL